MGVSEYTAWHFLVALMILVKLFWFGVIILAGVGVYFLLKKIFKPTIPPTDRS